jgi:two-component system phosphate regulon response regulator PhoB
LSGIKILVVEDESAIRELLGSTLSLAGYEVAFSPDGLSARNWLDENTPDLVIVDWMMPGMSGLDLTRWMKQEEMLADLPIIMLTARDDEDYKVQGLEAGVDDYVTKPFSTRELLARVKAVLRRSVGEEQSNLKMDMGLEMDLLQHRVLCCNKPVLIGPTEYKLLHFFMTHQDRVYSRTQLLDLVWGRNVYIEERTVDVHIRRLRKALSPSKADYLIQTVRGVGYRFSETIEASVQGA